MKFKWVRGYGIFIEAIILFIINCLYIYYIIYEKIKYISPSEICSISIIDIITILTSLSLFIGFIYYVGYMIARRKDEPNAGFGGGKLREVILPYGVILFSAFIIPLLIVFLIKSGISYIILLAINILSAILFGFVNEWITQKYKGMGFERDKRERNNNQHPQYDLYPNSK